MLHSMLCTWCEVSQMCYLRHHYSTLMLPDNNVIHIILSRFTAYYTVGVKCCKCFTFAVTIQLQALPVTSTLVPVI